MNFTEQFLNTLTSEEREFLLSIMRRFELSSVYAEDNNLKYFTMQAIKNALKKASKKTDKMTELAKTLLVSLTEKVIK